jgi:hypothetical protein
MGAFVPRGSGNNCHNRWSEQPFTSSSCRGRERHTHRAHLDAEEHDEKQQDASQQDAEANGEQDEVSNHDAEAVRYEQVAPVPTFGWRILKATIERVINHCFDRLTNQGQGLLEQRNLCDGRVDLAASKEFWTSILRGSRRFTSQ